MKKNLFALLFCYSSLYFSQEGRFVFTSSYGLSYIDYAKVIYALPPEAENNLTTEINPIGTVLGIELDYNILVVHYKKGCSSD